MTKQNPNIENIPIVFIDVETTGFSPERDRIIDIAMLKVVNGVVVDKFDTLVNPENLQIPSYISYMTGIDGNALESAPTFSDIAKKVNYFLEGSVFAAHNVNFDYGFVKSELFRTGIKYNSKRMCTVRLFKNIVPGKRRYGLDSLIDFYGIKVDKRHTAMGDTLALVEFWKKILNEVGQENVYSIVTKLIKKPTIPPKVIQDEIDKLPKLPGVYIFKSNTNTPLYIGKSINIKQRVLNHFGNVTSNLDQKIIKETSKIKYIETAGEFGALMLESKLIKKYLPLYNKKLRRSKNLIAVIAKESFSKYSTIEFKNISYVEDGDLQNIVGVFKNIKEANNFVYQKCESNNICLKVLNIEKGDGSCFNYKLGKCNGACLGKESNVHHNIRFIQAFTASKVSSWPFKGTVLLKEESKNGLTEWHIINHWKYLGKYTNTDNIPNTETLNKEFNYDEYKIISKFIKTRKNIKIQEL